MIDNPIPSSTAYREKEIESPLQVDTNTKSFTILVNKEYGLPSDFVPDDLILPDILFSEIGYHEKKLMRKEAAKALELLFQTSISANLTLYAVSGYRSYQRQKEIYEENIARRGVVETDKYSAKPGHSEHQTGLSMDVSTSTIQNRLETVFAGTPEGKWLRENAHLFGFITRYPKDKVHLTQYAYEPWHIRYVGVSLAEYLFHKKLTLEEYYHCTPSSFIP